VKYLDLTITEKRSHTIVSPKLAIAAIVLGGVVGVMVERPEIVTWVVEKFKAFGAVLGLGLIPALGMVMGGGGEGQKLEMSQLIDEAKGILEVLSQNDPRTPEAVFAYSNLSHLFSLDPKNSEEHKRAKRLAKEIDIQIYRSGDSEQIAKLRERDEMLRHHQRGEAIQFTPGMSQVAKSVGEGKWKEAYDQALQLDIYEMARALAYIAKYLSKPAEIPRRGLIGFGSGIIAGDGELNNQPRFFELEPDPKKGEGEE